MVYIQPYISKRYYKVVFGFFIVSVICLAVIAIYINNKSRDKNLAYQFNGVVDTVFYNVQGKATIFMHDTDYNLSEPNWDFDHNRIQAGDSMIKKKGSMIIKLIKPNGKIIVVGED
jgi:hypothetical protein